MDNLDVGKMFGSISFNPEMLAMYQNYMTAAAATMMTAFDQAARLQLDNSGNTSMSIPTSPPPGLDLDIPRHEIECDPEILIVANLMETLKKKSTNLNGLHGKKFGFREVIEIARTRPAYPSTPSSLLGKRSRSMLNASAGPSNLSLDNEIDSKRICMTPSTSNSDASNEAADVKPFIQAPVEPFAFNEAPVDAPVSPVTPQTPPTTDTMQNKMVQFRAERLREVHLKKPKFSIDKIELKYHANMARNFPGSEFRTAEQQQRRDKNTQAARISRTKNKAHEVLLKEQSVDVTIENIDIKRQLAVLRAYCGQLMKQSKFPSDRNLAEMWEENLYQMAEKEKREKAEAELEAKK